MHLLKRTASGPQYTCVGAACQCSSCKDSHTGTSLSLAWRRLGDTAPKMC